MKTEVKDYEYLEELQDIAQLESARYVVINGSLVTITKYHSPLTPRADGDFTVINTNSGSFSENFLMSNSVYRNDIRLLDPSKNPEYFL